MLVIIYNYIHDEIMVDNRNIHTRRHDGVLFKILPIEPYKVKQDPMVMAVTAWNELPLEIRIAEDKQNLKRILVAMTPNPYANVL